MKARGPGLIFLIVCGVAACVTSVNAQSFDEVYERASQASRAGKLDEAITYYTRAIELKPFESLYMLRAFIYRDTGRFDLSLADINKAIAIEPGKAHENIEERGRLYVAMGKYDLAVADFTQVLKMRPARARIYNDRSEAYLLMGKPELAYADFANLLNSKDPNDANIGNAVLVSYLSLRKAGKAVDAKKFIDEWAPQFAAGTFDGMIARFLRGDVTEAQLLADPKGDNAWSRFYIGEMLVINGKSALAAEHFRFVKEKGYKFSFGYFMSVVELDRIAKAAK